MSRPYPLTKPCARSLRLPHRSPHYSPQDEVSFNQVDLGDIEIDAAYATMEGMVVYTCDTYPGEGRVDFYENVLRDGKGNDISNIKWAEEIRHDECDQGVEVGSGGDVSLTWDPTL